jgi:aminoglycoside phosphotransferase family enzyme
LEPTAYPHPATEVRLIQTHISYVFLAGDYAYKVKKPVNLGFLDYSTLERREHFCRREVELNRRLCPDVYPGVAPIVRTSDEIRVGGDGAAIEWCVVMRRLPEDRLLSRLLAAGRVTSEEIRAVACTLARFHATAATGGEIDAFGAPDHIRENTDENFRQLRPFAGRFLPADQLARVQASTNLFLDRNGPLFAERIRAHRIRDCHGDVHASSVCLTDRVIIFDCIEFNDRFRYGDVASEVAFLAMNLAHYGRADLARELADAYRAASRDDLPPDLLAFYVCYRAVVRAKVACLEADEAEVAPDKRREANREARAYANLADASAVNASGKL